jgi:hypothetical protein
MTLVERCAPQRHDACCPSLNRDEGAVEMTACEPETEVDPRKLATVVYDDRVSIDSLLTAFASELRAAGTRIAGLVQLPSATGGCGPGSPMRLWDVATGQTFLMCSGGEGPGPSCHLDLERFEQASNRLLALCDTDASLLFVSRFGKMEARGRGFRAAIAKAVERRLPVLTAVQRGRVPNWFEFTGGMGSLLDARLWVLRQWWQEIAPVRG